jgi:hypothetical protein
MKQFKTKNVLLMSFTLILLAGYTYSHSFSKQGETVANKIDSEKLEVIHNEVKGDLDRSSEAASSYQISKNGPISNNETDITIQVQKIQNLSKIVMQTPEKIKQLRKLLDNPRLQALIHQSMNDPNTYKGNEFTNKLRLLDVFYEGIKFPEQQISQKYFDLAEVMLVEDPDTNTFKSLESQHEFIADRAEIALTLLKAFPKQALEMETRVQQNNPKNLIIFKNARRLLNTYEVAL